MNQEYNLDFAAYNDVAPAEATGDFALIPKGDYPARVDNITSMITQGGTPYIHIEYTIVSGEYAKRKVFSDLWMSQNAVPYTKANLACLLQACGLDPRIFGTNNCRNHTQLANLVRDKVFSLGVMIKKGGKKEDGSLYDDKNDVNYRDVRPLARTQSSTIPQQTVKQAVQPPVQPSYGYAPQNPQPPMPQRPVAPMQQPQAMAMPNNAAGVYMQQQITHQNKQQGAPYQQPPMPQRPVAPMQQPQAMAMPNNAAGVYMQQQITHQNKQQGAPYQQPPMPQMQTFEQAAATATEDDIPF